MRKRLASSFFLLLTISLLVSCRQQNKEISIQGAWARPGIAGGNSAVYFTIDNPHATSDTLLKASGDAAGSVELHMSSMDMNGIMMMRPVDSVPVPAQSSVEFKPGGLHVMLVGLKQDLQDGTTITLTLDFESASDMTIEIPVKESN